MNHGTDVRNLTVEFGSFLLLGKLCLLRLVSVYECTPNLLWKQPPANVAAAADAAACCRDGRRLLAQQV